MDDQYWADATMALLQVSNAILLTPGWPNSPNSKKEAAEAQRRGMHQFYAPDLTNNRIEDWVAAWYKEQANEL